MKNVECNESNKNTVKMRLKFRKFGPRVLSISKMQCVRVLLINFDYRYFSFVNLFDTFFLSGENLNFISNNKYFIYSSVNAYIYFFACICLLDLILLDFFFFFFFILQFNQDLYSTSGVPLTSSSASVSSHSPCSPILPQSVALNATQTGGSTTIPTIPLGSLHRSIAKEEDLSSVTRQSDNDGMYIQFFFTSYRIIASFKCHTLILSIKNGK